jgi:glutamate-1-semialdehyde 2,1-aminomutase
MNNTQNSYDQSKVLHERATKVLAGGVSSEFRKFSQPHPLFYTRGEGSRIWDADGNEYLDFTLSQGPLILGHNHPRVAEKIVASMQDGQLFAGQHLQELELAEKIQSLIPCAELMRFSLSGAEADHTALRVSRAATGRTKFVRFEGHYHGWFDNVAVGISGASEEAMGPRENPTPVAWTAGLPPRIEDELFILPWNDLALVEKLVSEKWSEIAAIITEPVMCNNGCILPEPGFLEGLREICDRHGIVLIFDEVITGFRLGMSGAQGYFGVTPDIGIFGKAMASGHPISVVCGKSHFGAENKPLLQLLADGTVIHAGTMNSCNSTVAASLATIEVLEDGVHERLFALGNRLKAGLQAAAVETGHSDFLVQGPGPMLHVGFTSLSKVTDYRGTLSYDKAKYGAFLRGMQEAGIRLIGRGLWYISAAHVEADIDRAIATAKDVLKTIK